MKLQDAQPLLDDSLLVIRYATGAGMLEDGALSLEYERVFAANAAERQVDLTPLRVELDKKIGQISPFISLADLRAGRSPFDKSNQKITKVLQIALAFLSLILVIVVARYAIDLNDAGAMLTIFQEYQQSQPAEKLERLRILSESKVTHDLHSAEYQEYARLKEELEVTVDKARGALSGAEELSINPWAQLWSRLSTGVPSANGQERERPQTAVLSSSPVAAAAPAAALQAASSPGANAVPPVSDESYINEARSDRDSAYNFAMALNLVLSGFTFSIISQLQSYIYIRSAWILPGLAGLLGSSVYLMRFFLFNRKLPIIEWYQVVVRVAMGGAAGVIIGWFIVAPPEHQSGLVATTSVPFGVAFLTGFSIDVLFSMLDRINKAIVEPNGPGLR